MACETAKESWDKLREEFIGSDTTRNMQVLNLRREFKTLRMQEAEKVKEYVDRLMNIVNKIRLLRVEMLDSRIVEKVVVSLPERFEAKISSLEDSKDLTQITLIELVHALQAQEQRRLLRLEDANEGAMLATYKGKNGQGNCRKFVGEKRGKERANNQWNKTGGMKSFPAYSHCKRKGHAEYKCWFRPGIKCRACKQFGHVERVCKNKGEQSQQQSQIVDEQQPVQETEQLFVASSNLVQTCDDTWLIDKFVNALM
ncbi:uncharacterized protein LOC116105800 [Pistacia vera]|uniref:uncharacterized protein LOC116105800 n=1 Tax=Pistacia vera TaxID=55513 RepID=UPI001262DE39|nr:uncharacterized protein LOC116105800 [Pistacia vera]